MKETVIKLTCAAFAALLCTGPVAARDIDVADDKLQVLGCLEQMELTTTWPQCLELMFQPCATEEAGTEAHATCLGGIRQDWSGTMTLLQDEVFEAVTPNGSNQLINLITIWTDYVVGKCEEVAQSKPGGEDSARLGCEVSEIVGLSGEFAACLEGRSLAEYCEIKE